MHKDFDSATVYVYARERGILDTLTCLTCGCLAKEHYVTNWVEDHPEDGHCSQCVYEYRSCANFIPDTPEGRELIATRQSSLGVESYLEDYVEGII